MSARRKVTNGCLLVIALTVIGLGFSRAPQVGAFSLPQIVDNVKDFLTPPSPKELTIISKIELASGGDLNKNGQIDSGEIVFFEYTINNSTDSDYRFATLETNINKDQLNFIHNITGTASLTQANHTIVIPNLLITAHTAQIVQFEARVNYFKSGNLDLTTEPRLLTNNKQLIKQSARVTKSVLPLKGNVRSVFERKDK